jgi:hypothetical protein
MSAPARRLLLPLLLALILTSCATTGTGAIDAEAIATICAAWPAVTWSSRDTQATVADAKANNAARAAFCAPASGAGAAGG